MTKPIVNKGEWIVIGKQSPFGGVHGYVFNVHADGSLSVGYYQNKLKAVKEDVVWDGEHWQFRNSGPDASYLRGVEERIVKNGPPRT